MRETLSINSIDKVMFKILFSNFWLLFFYVRRWWPSFYLLSP